ncbi:hypothetical protein D9M72_443460 [compost metagenome]
MDEDKAQHRDADPPVEVVDAIEPTEQGFDERRAGRHELGDRHADEGSGRRHQRECRQCIGVADRRYGQQPCEHHQRPDQKRAHLHLAPLNADVRRLLPRGRLTSPLPFVNINPLGNGL